MSLLLLSFRFAASAFTQDTSNEILNSIMTERNLDASASLILATILASWLVASVAQATEVGVRRLESLASHVELLIVRDEAVVAVIPLVVVNLEVAS